MAEDVKARLERLSLGERWDVIVCDLVMPGMNGLELRHRVMKMAPELADKFVFVSGGAFDPLLREQLAELGLGYLDKPPDRNTLRAAVAKLVR
jgi:CheY-like chemotaxis protein